MVPALFLAGPEGHSLKMQWNQGQTIAIAKYSCRQCKGLGMVERGGEKVPCNCVFRRIFRACWNRFRECVAPGPSGSAVTLEFCNGRDRRRSYSRKREEFVADFTLVVKRTLNEAEYRLFRYHFLLGANWKLCSRALHMDRGSFFHEVYRIENKLGQTFAELEPFALYPL